MDDLRADTKFHNLIKSSFIHTNKLTIQDLFLTEIKAIIFFAPFILENWARINSS